MKMHYSLPRLSPRERERLIEILLEEMEAQQWFAIAFSERLNREIIVLTQ